jgi:hypothetical protein
VPFQVLDFRARGPGGNGQWLVRRTADLEALGHGRLGEVVALKGFRIAQTSKNWMSQFVASNSGSYVRTAMSKRSVTIPDEAVMRQIHVIRGQKVMLDRDLAALYGVETRRLNEQVRRNIDRFPLDFMFEMTNEELTDWKSQFATSNREVMGLRKRPLVFTEHGVLMLSSVLNSKTAVAVTSRSSGSSPGCGRCCSPTRTCCWNWSASAPRPENTTASSR